MLFNISIIVSGLSTHLRSCIEEMEKKTVHILSELVQINIQDSIQTMAPIKYPPVFDPDEDNDYVSWKNDVEVWKLYTSEDKKLGLAIYLSLKGKARDAVRELKPQDLNADDGFDIVIRNLDSVYLKDETIREFCAFQEFHSYKRSSGENFSDFIVKWEHLYQKIVQFDMKLPEGVKAYFLLNAANMSAEYDKFARTTVKELNYAEMKDKVMKIFGDPLMTDDKGGVPQIKSESDVFYSKSDQTNSKRTELAMKMYCSTGKKKVEVIKGTEEALGQIEAEGMVGIDAEVEEMSVVGLMIDELEDTLKKLINKILLAMMEVR